MLEMNDFYSFLSVRLAYALLIACKCKDCIFHCQITGLRRRILPFLMSLSVDQRTKLRKAGRSSFQYVKLAYVGAHQFCRPSTRFSTQKLKKSCILGIFLLDLFSYLKLSVILVLSSFSLSFL